MADCCADKGCEIIAMRESQGRLLWIVLAINALMFVVEGWAGLLAHSTSLLADALDMLCSRVDLIANVGVLIAAGVTYLLASRWPDIIVGCIIAILFLRSAFSVLSQATRALRQPSPVYRPS